MRLEFEDSSLRRFPRRRPDARRRHPRRGGRKGDCRSGSTRRSPRRRCHEPGQPVGSVPCLLAVAGFVVRSGRDRCRRHRGLPRNGRGLAGDRRTRRPRCRLGGRCPRDARCAGAARHHDPRRRGRGDAARHDCRPHRPHHGVHQHARLRPHRVRTRASILEDDGGAGTSPRSPQQDRDRAEQRVRGHPRIAVPDGDDAGARCPRRPEREALRLRPCRG